MKVLTSFMSLNTGEGGRITYTYSEIDESTGSILSQNNKGNFLVLDANLQTHIDAIKDYIASKHLQK